MTNEAEVKTPIDLVELFTKPLDEMTTEELEQHALNMRQVRKTKISSKKKKQDYLLDYVLPNLTPEKAEMLLKKLGDWQSSKAEEAEEDVST